MLRLSYTTTLTHIHILYVNHINILCSLYYFSKNRQCEIQKRVLHNTTLARLFNPIEPLNFYLY